MALERLRRCRTCFATQLLLLYRYIFVLGEEALRMTRARSLRSFGRRGMGLRVYAQMLGQLLLRTYARAQRVYLAMLCRGFDGQVRIARRLRLRVARRRLHGRLVALFVVVPPVNVPLLVGGLVTGVIA